MPSIQVDVWGFAFSGRHLEVASRFLVNGCMTFSLL